MRYKRTLIMSCILLLAALLAVQSVGADFGISPGWSPGSLLSPILPLTDISTALSSAGKPVNMDGVSPLSLTDYLPGPMPLVDQYVPKSYDAVSAPEAVSVPGSMPTMNLVDTPLGGSTNAVEVPNGGSVLVDGTTVTCGSGIVTGIPVLTPPPTPPGMTP